MKYRDYYKILGVTRDTSAENIKKAYRRLARKYHPDVSKELKAEESFKEVNEAYEVLRDPQKRATYDQLGNKWHAGQDFCPPPGCQPVQGSSNFRTTDFSDFFESLFGSLGGISSFTTGRSKFQFSSNNQAIPIEISLEEAYYGGICNLQVQVRELDTNGESVIRPRNINVKIPVGVTTGKKIRVSSNQSSPDHRQDSGLILEIVIKPHQLYRIKGRDIILTLPLAPWEAALGCKIEIPTLGGMVTINVPANAYHSQKLRLRGRGLPGQPPGDQIAVLCIVNPPADSEAAREVFRFMERKLPFDPRLHWRKQTQPK